MEFRQRRTNLRRPSVAQSAASDTDQHIPSATGGSMRRSSLTGGGKQAEEKEVEFRMHKAAFTPGLPSRTFARTVSSELKRFLFVVFP